MIKGKQVQFGATANDVHVDKVLTQMALGYKPTGFIADMISPVVRVQKQTDIYTEFDRGRRLRIQDTQRAPGTPAHRVEQDVGSATYHCKNYALSYPVTIEDKANADPMFLRDLYNARAELLIDDLKMDKEARVANQINNTANVGSSSAVNSAWNGAGDPLGDINAAIDNVKYANGIDGPNLIIFGPRAWDSFRRDTTVRNLINGNNNGGGYVNEAQVRNLLNVDKILVAGAFVNSADDGQSENIQSMWNDNVAVIYNSPRPNRERPSFSYEFRWVGNGLADMTVERHPFNTRTKSEDVEVGYYGQEKIVGASYGFLLNAVNSST